ncbi:MAG: S41 family peptidase [Microscillaceae bacterium]
MKKTLILLLLLANNLVGLAQESILVKFKVDASSLNNITDFGVRGGASPLSWEKTVLLQDADKDGIYEGEIHFAQNIEVLEYKYVYGDKAVVWELEAQNRILLTNNAQIQTNDTWNLPSPLDVKKLPKISAEKLTEDFHLLKKALLDIHPGLYRYNTKAQIDSIFRHFQEIFSKPLTYQEAFLNFTRLTSAIKCGHTFPSFYNQTGFIQEVVLNQKDKLPFTFRVFDEKIFITGNAMEGAEIRPGTEILAIDGIPTPILLKETAKLVKADGANDGKRYADLNTFGVGTYFEMFDCYFPLLYPPVNAQYTVKIRRPGSEKTEELKVNTVSRAERTNVLIKQNPKHITKADQLWKLEFWENSTAYLQLGTFDVFQLSFEWSTFLKNAFKEIKNRKTKHLIIDIRWNEGGQDEVLLFIGQNISQQAIKIPLRKDLVRYNLISAELKPYLFTWDNTFFDLSQKTAPYNDDYFLFTGENITEVQPYKNAFDGNVYLLVNGTNSSATFYFAEIAKENKLATLIGETTGGSQNGLNAGTMFFLRLPHSKIEIDIPIIGSFSNEKAAGGIVPDIIVHPTVEDLVKGEDKVLSVTREIIEKK